MSANASTSCSVKVRVTWNTSPGRKPAIAFLRIWDICNVQDNRAVERHNRSMKVIADLCVVPLGIGVSVSKEVAICERILAAARLKTRLHAYGTNIEGEWDQVFAAVKQCHEALHAAGVPRISTNMRFGTRIDREQTMEDKIQSVERKLIG